MVQKASLLKEIIEIFSKERINIETLSAQGLLDEHNYWEDIICHLLNLILGYDLVNLNRKHETKNFPGIDLGDKDSGIGVQVSATKTSAKINNSLTKVKDNNVFIDYPNFIMFVLGKKQNSYSINPFDSRINFEKEKDVWDFDFLIEKITALEFEEVKEIRDYLDRELNRQQENEFRANISFILAYLNSSMKWLELAAEHGCFLTDAFVCDKYNERCEKLAGILPQEEYELLYGMLTDMSQAVEYIEQGISYKKGKKRGGMRYEDLNTIMLNKCVEDKASSALEKKNIIDILKKYVD